MKRAKPTPVAVAPEQPRRLAIRDTSVVRDGAGAVAGVAFTPTAVESSTGLSSRMLAIALGGWVLVGVLLLMIAFASPRVLFAIRHGEQVVFHRFEIGTVGLGMLLSVALALLIGGFS